MSKGRPKLPKLKGVSRKPYIGPPKRGAQMKGIKGYQRRLWKMALGRMK